MLQGMGNVDLADIGNRTIATSLQQGCHLSTEIGVIEQQAAHIRRSLIFYVEEAPGGGLSVRNYDRLKNADFALGL
jgi:hypothetical protein